jgi:hypothetical protein
MKNKLFSTLLLCSLNISLLLAQEGYFISLFRSQETYTLQPTAFNQGTLDKEGLLHELVLLQDTSGYERAFVCGDVVEDFSNKIALINIGGDCSYGLKCLKALKDSALILITEPLPPDDENLKGLTIPTFTLEPDLDRLEKEGIHEADMLRVYSSGLAYLYKVTSSGAKIAQDTDLVLDNSIKPTTLTGFIQLTPNPSTENTALNLSFSEATDTDVLLFNSIGQLLERHHLTQATQETILLHTQNYPAGQYQVSVVNAKENWRKTLLLVK